MKMMVRGNGDVGRRPGGGLAFLAAGALALAALCGAASASAATRRVDLSSAGVPANHASFRPSISADGRFVAFESFGTNLVRRSLRLPRRRIFVRDRTTRITRLVSDMPARAAFDLGGISADGRFVVFDAQAKRYDLKLVDDVFVRDLVRRETTRVSVNRAGAQANGGSIFPVISANGRLVAFLSVATDLVAGDTNGKPDVFVRDLAARKTTRVSVSSAGAQADDVSYPSSMSTDGRFVAIESYATNLVPGDTNGFGGDIFVHDRVTGETTRVSVNSTGAQANGHSSGGAISADGRFVAFSSEATNLVDGDTNGFSDVFVHDRQTGATTLVSKSGAGARGDGDSNGHGISADGRFVAFSSEATNLVDGDTNGLVDVFVHDRQTGATVRVSTSSAGDQVNFDCTDLAISADGRFVGFTSRASSLVRHDTNGFSDVFVVGPLLIQP